MRQLQERRGLPRLTLSHSLTLTRAQAQAQTLER